MAKKLIKKKKGNKKLVNIPSLKNEKKETIDSTN